MITKLRLKRNKPANACELRHLVNSYVMAQEIYAKQRTHGSFEKAYHVMILDTVLLWWGSTPYDVGVNRRVVLLK